MMEPTVHTSGAAVRAALSPELRATVLRYAGLPLPRHTSYPTVLEWNTAVADNDLRQIIARALQGCKRVGVYLHVPYCAQACYYCGCNRAVLPQGAVERDTAIRDYLAGVLAEVERYAPLIAGAQLASLHLGGGTPTYLTPDELSRLIEGVCARIPPAPDAGFSIEADPRVTTDAHLAALAKLGFRRISMGVQDLDPSVQQAVGRIQPTAMVRKFVAAARAAGFASVNFDLIHGLPYQSAASMRATLDEVIALAPDRIAYYRLAVLPDLFDKQKLFRADALPDPALCLDLMLLAIAQLGTADYRFIGLDHFALPHDPLSRALDERTLRRSFQGMTTGGDVPLIGLGPSAISQLDGLFLQNFKDTAAWARALQGPARFARVKVLSPEDRLRGALLQELYSQGAVHWHELDDRFALDSRAHFAALAPGLDLLEQQGILVQEQGGFALTQPMGRLLTRVAAALFDAYLPADAFRTGLAAGRASQV